MEPRGGGKPRGIMMMGQRLTVSDGEVMDELTVEFISAPSLSHTVALRGIWGRKPLCFQQLFWPDKIETHPRPVDIKIIYFFLAMSIDFVHYGIICCIINFFK